jgi:hypothetical protein
LGAYCTTASVTGITVQPPMPLRGNVTSCSWVHHHMTNAKRTQPNCAQNSSNERRPI